jgi:prepilin-type N-terminal cleavage/methylation domain-containing protein
MRKKTGFTLLELLMVIIVIGILVTFAIPSYISSLERAKCAKAISTVKSIRNAAIAYHRENQDFSGMSIAALETLVEASFADTVDWAFAVQVIGSDGFEVRANRLSGPHRNTSIILDERDDFTGSSYPYQNPGQH